MNRLNGLNRKLLFCVAAVFVMALAGVALAHTPLFSCWDNGDGTLSCEGGFSDGSSAANIPIRVTNEKDEVIFEGKLDEGFFFIADTHADGLFSRTQKNERIGIFERVAHLVRYALLVRKAH